MIDSVYIFDDIIDRESQNILENYFLSNDSLFVKDNNIRYFGDEVYMPQSVIVPKVLDTNIDTILKTIENNSIKKIGKTILKNYRYKINKLEVVDNDFDDIMSLHIDRYEEHLSIVYYVNDTDGNTCIYDIDLSDLEKWQLLVRNRKFEKFKFKQQISPKKGRVVVFNGLLPHHSSYPTINDRYVVNFNTVIETNPTSLF
jgi:hypothetical protein